MNERAFLPHAGAELARRRVHVIDPDTARRARVHRDLAGLHVDVRLYKRLPEFFDAMPEHGAVLAADDPANGPTGWLLAAVKSGPQPLPVALYAPEPSPVRIVQALIKGACDYLPWPFDPASLSASIGRLTADGEPAADGLARRARARCRIAALSPLEGEVLSLLAEGYSATDMAERMGRSAAEVRLHRGNMLRKLNAASLSAAVGVAIEAGLDEDNPWPSRGGAS